MQLFAKTSCGEIVNVKEVEKREHYYCISCNAPVKKREGPCKRAHFYHMQQLSHCASEGKGLIHAQIQAILFSLLPKGECTLEARFPTIQRVADVAWFKEKIIFEIQYSPISDKEVLARNQAYASLGWKVVWILHDHLYNQQQLTAAEQALIGLPHYFSNINEEGIGWFYDQMQIVSDGKRIFRLPKFPFSPTQPRPSTAEKLFHPIAGERQKWPLFFKGDLFDLALHSPEHPYLKSALEADLKFADHNKQTFKNLWSKWIQTTYNQLFDFFFHKLIAK